MANDLLIKNSELLNTQHIPDILDTTIARLKNEKWWRKFTKTIKYREGRSSYEYNVKMFNDLTEVEIIALASGVTPPPSKLSYFRKSGSVADYGRWIAYTDKTIKYNFDDVVAHAKAVISDEMVQIVEHLTARQFTLTKRTMTVKSTTWATLGQARILLKKQKAGKIDGKYIAVVTPEYAQVILDENKDAFQGDQKNSIMETGFIGTLNGFHIFEAENADVLYLADGKQLALFFGTNPEEGGFPVAAVECGAANVEVWDNGLGSLPDEANPQFGDALKQRGSIAGKIMGFGTTITNDNYIIKCEITLDTINEGVITDVEQLTGAVAGSHETSPSGV